MAPGWIKLHRQFLDWEWYKDTNTKSLFLHLLLCANREAKKWQGITIDRGQLATGRKQLSAELGISEQSVRTSMERLKSTSELTIKTTNKFSIITINKYDLYQNGEPSNQQPNQQLTNNQPASNQQLTTTKEVKKIRSKEVKNKKVFTPPLISEVVAYFLASGYTEQSAKKAFRYYDDADWIDSKGNKVKNWKQKMQGVWFKDENKMKTSLNYSIGSQTTDDREYIMAQINAKK